MSILNGKNKNIDKSAGSGGRLGPSFLRRLIPYLKPYLKHLILLLLIIFLSSGLNALPPLILRISVDKYMANNNFGGVALMALSIVLLGVAIAGTGYVQKKTGQFVGHSVVRDIRDDTFVQINRLPFEFFDKTQTGDIVSRIMFDTERLRMFISKSIVNLLVNIFLLIGVLAMIFSWNYRLGLLFTSIFPFIYVGMRLYTRKILPANREARKANSMLTSIVHETFSGMREIKLYGQEDYAFSKFNEYNEKYFDAIIRVNKYSAFWGPYIPFILNMLSALFFLVGGLLVIRESLTLGMLMAAIAYFGLLTSPVRAIANFFGAYNNARAAAERIFELMDVIPAIKDSEDAVELDEIRGEIEFRDVHFSYVPGNEILKGISFRIEPGELVALVGPSGAGKTTLVHLIPRYYDVTSGCVLIDGLDVRRIALRSLRKNIGVIMQRVFLFDGSIRENLLYGNENADEETLWKAIRAAQLESFVRSLPDGLDTPIGERGVKLSGGQAQRITLARALVTDPKILILDEPTANVDALTDHKIMAAVRALMKGRTTVVIAHRLWTVKNADKIIVLRDGRIEGIGSHEELLRTCDFYREFFVAQFQTDEASMVSLGGNGEVSEASEDSRDVHMHSNQEKEGL